jgi:hypothetical protein
MTLPWYKNVGSTGVTSFERELRTERASAERFPIVISIFVVCWAESNTTEESFFSCIALCPTNNKNGSVLFYSFFQGRL